MSPSSTGGDAIEHVYDFTSDTATIPTDDMFDIMKMASRGDDVFAADKDVNELEAFMADLLGQEAALFCASGTMTNQLGLRTLLTQPPHSVLCDARAHIFVYECGGIGYHSQASITPVTPKNGKYLTVEDVKANVVTDTLCGAPTKVVALENTLNGTLMPIEEIKKIREYCDANGLYLHLDGARLWNASAATGIPMKEYGQLFDTVSVCLSKGAGAPIGSIVASTKDRIRHARHLRKLLGGGWRQAGFLALAARHCIDTVVPRLPETHQLAAKLAKHLQDLGVQLVLPCETNMVFIDLAPVNLTVVQLAEALREKRIKITKSAGTITRIVLHYQITPEAVQDFIDVATDLISKSKSSADPTAVSVKQAVPENETTAAPNLGNAYPSMQSY